MLRGAEDWTDDQRQAYAEQKSAVRMAEIDALPVEFRELVHEYGYAVVKSLIDCGVKKPAQVRHCVERILDEFSPTRGSSSRQGMRRGPRSSPTEEEKGK